MRDDQPEGWRRVRSTGRGNNKMAAAAACCRQHALCTAAAALQGAHLWPAQTSCPSSGASPAAERFDKKTSTQMPQAPVAVLPRAWLRQEPPCLLSSSNSAVSLFSALQTFSPHTLLPQRTSCSRALSSSPVSAQNSMHGRFLDLTMKGSYLQGRSGVQTQVP